MTLKEMRERRTALLTAARDLASKIETEAREATEDEIKQLSDAKTEADVLETRIAAAETFHANVTDIQTRLSAEPPARRTNPGTPGSYAEAERIEFSRPRPLRMFRADTFAQANEQAYRAGQWLAATVYGNERANQWCKEHGLRPDYRGFVESRALGESTNTAGGVMVPDELERTIISNREEYGTFRRNCKVLPMLSDTKTIPRRVTGYTEIFVGENSAGTAADMAFDGVGLTAKKTMCGPQLISSELMEDAVIELADLVAEEFTVAMAYHEDVCGWNGTGAGGSTYAGIVGATVRIVDGTHTVGAVDATAGVDTFAEITATDLAKVMAVCPQYARPNAKWYCSGVAFDLVFSRLAATAGGNTITTLAGKVQPAYLGYPIEISQVLESSTGTINNTPFLLFGDLRRAATLGERRGFRLSMTTERYWEYDQIGLKMTRRFDINVHDLGDTSSAGPLVALIGCTS